MCGPPRPLCGPSPQVNQWFQEYAVSLKYISTHKFLPLAYQLVSRLSPDPEAEMFQKLLQSLLRRLARDHPYHILYHIHALTHSPGDTLTGPARGVPRERGKPDVAKAMLQELGRDPKLTDIMKQMKVLTQAYMQLAEAKVGDQYKNRLPSRVRRRGSGGCYSGGSRW